jgi:hypothetical protein
MDIEIVSPAPVLNTPDFRHAFGGDDGLQIPRNASGHPCYNEFVALPHMRFEIEEEAAPHIYLVRSKEYPAEKLYIDSRFTRPAASMRSPALLPSKEELVRRMERLLGTSYVWGGNWSAGIPELLALYPPQGSISDHTQILWTFKGVDCSGLLFEASNGLTPRNTSQLIHFGTDVPIAGKSPQEIRSSLQPMDIVVWPGHTWYVLNDQFSIESRSSSGVVLRPLLERLEETCQERKGVDRWEPTLDPKAHFVIRRIL